MEDKEVVLELKDVEVEFKTLSGGRMKAMDGVSLKLYRNELVAIIGRSGCGKSTLLNVIAGLLKPTRGEALMSGKPIAGPGQDRGVMFQGDTVFGWKKINKNVDFALKLGNVPKEKREALIDEYLAMVHLQDFKKFYPKELSGGMRKRLQLAMVLANSPEMLLMDEPFGALDYATKIDMQMEVERLRMTRPITTLFVSHDVEEATYLADRIILMEAGKIVEERRVDIPRPRGLEVRQDPEFLKITRHFLDFLLKLDREEVVK